MANTKELLDKAFDFYGGTKAWDKLSIIHAHVKMGGITWGLKGHAGAVDDVHFTAALHQQQVNYHPLFAEGLRSEFTPGRVALVDGNDNVVEELLDPRDSFKGHTLTTPWTRLQLVYFSSYALWNYLTAPFNFLMPGMLANELEPWQEKGQTWRRLEMIYPDNMARHSKRQVYYFSPQGRIDRLDYWPEVLANAPASQIIGEYKEFSGIKVGTRRGIYGLNEADNSYQTDPVLISIDVVDVRYE